MSGLQKSTQFYGASETVNFTEDGTAQERHGDAIQQNLIKISLKWLARSSASSVISCFFLLLDALNQLHQIYLFLPPRASTTLPI